MRKKEAEMVDEALANAFKLFLFTVAGGLLFLLSLITTLKFLARKNSFVLDEKYLKKGRTYYVTDTSWIAEQGGVIVTLSENTGGESIFLCKMTQVPPKVFKKVGKGKYVSVF